MSALPDRDQTARFLPAKATDAFTEDDIGTLTHLLRAGVGRNTLRALRSDLGCLEAWSLDCTGDPLTWPSARETPPRFIANRLWDP